MGDVFEDRTPSRLEEVVRNANREALERQIREDDVASRESMNSSRAAAAERQSSRSRVSMESRGSAAGRPSLSSSTSHRAPRFLTRLGSQHSRVKSNDSDDLMEQGLR